MSKKMLIDASHPEETRVVVVDGTRIDELDFESENKRQLRGNVYLARVTRVEPSLQAAFVEYGGNRHGFLAFSEIHPDYYQIPYEDRMALIEAEEAENLAEDDENESDDDKSSDGSENDDDGNTDANGDDDNVAETIEDDADDTANDEDVVEEQEKISSSRRKRMSRRRYKIQEVIKRGQILLIQVVKEERGNKGAAMTTYLSLAGRYCVLMPNTPRGGGISRKISNGSDRKHLKSIVSEFEVPQGMGVIVRTAGAKRTKTEIKRDYDYLSRLWETIRETTLKSIAPALIYEEGNLVKRSIRDLYNKEISEILVQGDEAYKTAKSFIKMLMPSHAKNVKAYKDPIPLFLRYQVESQLEDSMNSVVQLKSGGYLVIHPTEALVSVDVNSGRSTKERNVERTALKTNLEAAEEVARQMRLRDLAGLIVIDFIDMDENRNNRSVEKRMRDALSQDRARVQHSRISQFGLMEISRQRRRRSLLEGSTAHCEHCEGIGRKRTVESSALRAIRAIEETGSRGQAARIRITVAKDVVYYLINEKRELLRAIDERYDMFTEIVGNNTLIRPNFEIDVVETRDTQTADPLKTIEKEAKEAEKENAKSRGRRRKKSDDDAETDTEESNDATEDNADDDDGSSKRRRRRGRRGGRRRKSEGENAETTSDEADKDATPDALAVITPEADDSKTDSKDDETSEKPKPRRRRKPAKSSDDTPEVKTDDAPKKRRKAPAKKQEVETAETADEEKSETPKSTRRRKAPAKKSKAAETETAEVDKGDKVETADDAPKSTVRRKAPSRKKPKSEKASEPEKAPAKPRRGEVAAPVRSTARRKAPGRASSTEDKAPSPVSDSSPTKAPEVVDTPDVAKSDTKPKAKKKSRGLFGRRKKSED